MIHFNTYIPERIKKGNAIYEMIFGAGIKTASSDWLKYLPNRERQWWLPFCVAFSRLDCAEAVAKKAGKTLNFSERRLAVESGTSKRGNTLDAVSACFRKNGVDKEEDTPLTEKMIADGWNAWEEINNLPRAGERYFGGSHSWILSKAAMIDALDHSPLQIAIGETDANWERDGEVQNPTKIDWYHAVILRFIDADGKFYVRDSIGKPDKILNKNYPIGWCKSFRDLPEDWKDTMNQFVKIIKDKNSSSVGFWIPALNENALETLALGFNKVIEKKSDGTIDWNVTIEGELELKNNLT